MPSSIQNNTPPQPNNKITPISATARQQNAPDKIDLIALASYLLHKGVILVASALVCALAFGLYTHFCIKPIYKSTAKLYIVGASGDSVVNLTDLNLGTNLTNDYRELILNYPVLDQVVSALDLNMSADALRGMISLSTPANTRVLAITASTTDPQLSMNIANTLAGVARTYLPETMSTPTPNVAQVALAAKSPSSPNLSRNVMMGGLAGFAVAAAILTLMFIMNDAVQGQTDFENTFSVPVLAAVPDFNQRYHGGYGNSRNNSSDTPKKPKASLKASQNRRMKKDGKGGKTA